MVNFQEIKVPDPGARKYRRVIPGCVTVCQPSGICRYKGVGCPKRFGADLVQAVQDVFNHGFFSSVGGSGVVIVNCFQSGKAINGADLENRQSARRDVVKLYHIR